MRFVVWLFFVDKESVLYKFAKGAHQYGEFHPGCIDLDVEFDEELLDAFNYTALDVFTKEL